MTNNTYNIILLSISAALIGFCLYIDFIAQTSERSVTVTMLIISAIMLMATMKSSKDEE